MIAKLRTLKYSAGFTLLEILLVLAIVGAILTILVGYYQEQMTAFRNDKTAAQMQQILNAGMAYYVANGAWPSASGSSTALHCLQQDTTRPECAQQYLPTNLTSGWMGTYTVNSTAANLYVTTPITSTTATDASAYASIIAGKLPLGYIAATVTGTPPWPSIATCTTTTCNVVASVNVPGQNLSNATAINFAGLYHQGACVPVPTCPVDKNGTTMTPQVIVVPVQVGGYYDSGSNNVYPISSFTAYAEGGQGAGTSPAACNESPSITPSCASNIAGNAATDYWRACLQLVTERGDVQNQSPKNTDWGSKITMAAFTRCAVSNEPSGSSFSVYGN